MSKRYMIFTSADIKVLFSIDTFRKPKNEIGGIIEEVIASNSKVEDSSIPWKEPVFTIYYNNDSRKIKSDYIPYRINIIKNIQVSPSLCFCYSGVCPDENNKPDMTVLNSSTTKKEALLLYGCT